MRDWLLDRICDSPTIVVDTARAPAGGWCTLVISRDEDLSQLEPLHSSSWLAAQEAHAQVIQDVRKALVARGIPWRAPQSIEGERLRPQYLAEE